MFDNRSNSVQMERTLSARQLLEVRHRTLPMTGEWGRCVGTINRHGVVFFWGNSGNGKSTAVLSFLKELTSFGKVLYIPFEEGYSLSLQNSIRRIGLAECGPRFQILRNSTLEELEERLSRPKSPEFVALDSFQYMQITYRQYLAFRQKHNNKLLIFISHADGKQPAGRAARSVMYDADLKIWVEGYKAFSKGRFIGETGEAVIWQKGAEDYWGIKRQEEVI